MREYGRGARFVAYLLRASANTSDACSKSRAVTPAQAGVQAKNKLSPRRRPGSSDMFLGPQLALGLQPSRQNRRRSYLKAFLTLIFSRETFMMSTLSTENRRAQAGFTLVELAIVLVIVGLLIGGILKGQELIAATRVNSTASQVKAIEGAAYTFQDTYGGVPGDILNAAARLPSCVAARGCVPTRGADAAAVTANLGNGIINNTILENLEVDAAPAATATSEGTAFFNQLFAANLIGGLTTSGTGTDGGEGLNQTALSSAVDSAANWRIGSSGTTDINGAGGTTDNNAHYLALTSVGITTAIIAAGDAGASNIDGAGILAKTAGALDSKIDDGNPSLGAVRALGSAITTCTNGDVATSVYASSNTSKDCGIIVKVLQ